MTELVLNQSDFTPSEVLALETLATETGQTVEEVIAGLTSLYIAEKKQTVLAPKKIGTISDEYNLPIACRTLN